MPESRFIHLHVHSVFSFLDSTCRLASLVARVRELGMGAVAVTDHDGVYGAVRFSKAARAAGIKPIFGTELTTEGGHHLTLLAATREGYSNLCRMVTAGRFRVLREKAGASAASSRSNESCFAKATQDRQNSTPQDCQRPAGIGMPALQRGAGDEAPALRDECGRRQAPAQQTAGIGMPALQPGAGDEAPALRDECGRRQAPAQRPAGTGVPALRDLRKEPRCLLSTIAKCAEGVIALSGCRNGEVSSAVRRGDMQAARRAVQRFQAIFGRDRFFIELSIEEPGERERMHLARLADLAEEMGAPIVATANVHYLTPDEAPIQDVLACMQTLTQRDDWHSIRRRGAERYLNSPKQMMEKFAAYPEAIANTVRIAEMCEVDLGLGRMHFPHFRMREYEAAGGVGASPASYRSNENKWWPEVDEEVEGERAERLLEWLCREGLARRYGQKAGARGGPSAERLRHELEVIKQLGLCEYFLVVWDICEEARARGIRCSGRGSAADSLVSYLLGITQVDPIAARLLFERFLNPQRREMPDVDIDFDARRRDEMIEYVARRYGPEHTGMVATINTFNARSAIREVGKALGMPEELLDRVCRVMPYTSAGRIRDAIANLPELRGSGFDATALEELLDICEAIDGLPRHLSVHLGGVVISREPISHFTPLEVSAKGVIVCQFDKDDIEDLGLVKMDMLGLRNLAAVEETLQILREMRGDAPDLEHLPLDDERTFALLRSARTVGVFQLESPGMRGLLSRLQPTRFDDIIANISLFRPGPMQADMIGPYLARRHGEEPVTFLHPALEPALAETYGVILYQEQVLEVASALAGFTFGQSDSLRRAMTHDRSAEEMANIRETFLEGCRRRGVEKAAAEETFRRLSAFAAYGFCKGHAASFAIIAYQTAYLKAHHPAEFLAGILSNQPMGFYPPEVIVNEARHFGVEVRAVDVNRSRDRYWVEKGAIRVGLAQVRGLSAAGMRALLDARERGGPFRSLRDLCARTALARPMVENLIKAGALDRLGRSRRALLWELNEICATGARRRDRTRKHNGQLALLEGEKHPLALPQQSERERISSELETTGISVSCHPLFFARERLRRMGALTRAQLDPLPEGRRVRVAGIVIARQRPPTKSGRTVIFVTLEDETGLTEVTVFERVYQRWGKVIFSNGALIVDGVLQKRGRYGTVVLGQRFQGIWP